MDKISAEDKKQLIMPFSQAGEKNTSIGTANNVTINNLTKSNDEKFITSAIVELEI